MQNDLEKTQQEIENKAKKREAKKKPKMKVSGKSVFELKKNIQQKSNKKLDRKK